jgi:hypothetical protein
MKLFIINLSKKIIFIFAIISVFCLTVILLPSNPNISNGLLYGKVAKDSLLANTMNNRLIFVGGSNLSFGLMSGMIKDSLKFNPINTAIHGGIGLEYMLENTLYYIKENDIIVIAPEYAHFTTNTIHGGQEMIITMAEVDKFKLLSKLSRSQLKLILTKAPYYSLKKLNPFNYFIERDKYGIYGKYSFNNYGDAIRHYNLPNEKIELMSEPYSLSAFNTGSVEILRRFRDECNKIGASVFISYPSFHYSASLGSEPIIEFVDSVLKVNDFHVISNPYDYIMADTLFFNTSYHLNKNGAQIRTSKLISDLQKVLKPTNIYSDWN